MDCACGAFLDDGLHQVSGALECFSTSQTCLQHQTDQTDGFDDFCGTALLEAEITGGLSTPFGGNVNTCLGVEIPQGLGFYNLCIQSAFTDRGLEGCAAQMNGFECDCTVCDDSKFSVVFDCSHVDLSPFPGIPLWGPKVDTCQLLDYQQSTSV